MTSKSKVRTYFLSTVAPVVIGAASLAATSPALAQCTGPGTMTATGATPQTKCLTAIQIPGNPLTSFDISFVNPDRKEYYLADRSNSGIDIINTQPLGFLRTIGGFVGVVLNKAGTAVDNNHSGPDGVTSHGRWLYAGDGDSTLKVIDLSPSSSNNPIKQTISTGGTTRVDEMALTTDGTLLLAANNAEDPPFATLFNANGDNNTSNVSKIIKITVDPTIIVPNFGQSIEQPAWDPTTQRFYTSIPWIANNPPGCNANSNIGPVTCDGGLLVTDPNALTSPQCLLTPGVCQQGAFDPTTNTGVVPLHVCGPNGATVGPNDNLLLGCTPGNNANNTTTLVINATTKNYAHIANITGSDEVWFNEGDDRYYLGASKMTKPAGSTLGNGAVLGVVDGTSVLIESIPQSSGSHSVAADSKRNLIFVPQIWTRPAGTVPAGDANTIGAGPATVGQQLCGGVNGCIVVYTHDVKGKN
jgi:hypothetical protein